LIASPTPPDWLCDDCLDGLKRGDGHKRGFERGLTALDAGLALLQEDYCAQTASLRFLERCRSSLLGPRGILPRRAADLVFSEPGGGVSRGKQAAWPEENRKLSSGF
jgi:hypothetical protein